MNGNSRGKSSLHLKYDRLYLIEKKIVVVVVVWIIVEEIYLCYMLIKRLWLGARDLNAKILVNFEFSDAFG